MRIEPNSDIVISNCIDFEQISQMAQELWARIERCVERFFRNLRNNFCCCAEDIERSVVVLPPTQVPEEERPPVQILTSDGIPLIRVAPRREESEATNVNLAAQAAADFKFLQGNAIYDRQSELGHCSLIDQPAVPLLGEPYHYCNSNIVNYCPAKVCVKLPHSQLVYFPQAIQDKFHDLAAEKIDLYFMVFEKYRNNSSYQRQCSEKSILFHSWHYSDKNVDISCEEIRQRRVELDLIESCEVGLFEPENVRATDSYSRAISINQFGYQHLFVNRDVFGTAKISGRAAYFSIDSEKPWSSFYAAARHDRDGRAVAVFSIFVQDENDPRVAALCSFHNNNLETFREQVSRAVEPNLKQKILNLIGS